MGYLTRQPIDLPLLLEVVMGPERGGTALFVGSVRRGPDDGPIQAIEYSAYDEMVEAELERILAESAQRWPQTRVAVRHRVGRVPTGEASIAVAGAAPHREEAFAACRYVIEECKKRVPIWKKEFLEHGAERWRGNREAKEAR